MNEKCKLMPIGTAAKKAGISRQSLQYYLMVGLLEPTQISPTGRRLFDEKSIERIKLVSKLNESGYSLRDIRELFLEGKTSLGAEKLKRDAGKKPSLSAKDTKEPKAKD